MKILFAGSPELAISTLKALIGSEHEIVGVLTASDKKKGRGQTLGVSPIKEASLASSLKVLSPPTLKDEKVLEEIKSLRADIMVVFAYGKIFSQEFLDLFPKGAINVHPSLLPRHRGPSPLIATILAEEGEAGITLQKMAFKMDTGNILLQAKKSLIGVETLEDLMQWVSQESPILTLEALSLIEKGVEGEVQEEEKATYCYLIDKEMGFLDLSYTPSQFLAYIRALSTQTGTWLETTKGEKVFIEKASLPSHFSEDFFPEGSLLGLDENKRLLLKLRSGVIALDSIKKAGKKSQLAKDFWNGLQDKDSFRFKGKESFN